MLTAGELAEVLDAGVYALELPAIRMSDPVTALLWALKTMRDKTTEISQRERQAP